MLEHVKEQLVALKLHGMAEALEMQIRTPFAADMDFTERLQLMVQQEKKLPGKPEAHHPPTPSPTALPRSLHRRTACCTTTGHLQSDSHGAGP